MSNQKFEHIELVQLLEKCTRNLDDLHACTGEVKYLSASDKIAGGISELKSIKI